MKTAASTCETAGRLGASPRKGALQTKPATFSCRASCAASPHGRWSRPRTLGLEAASRRKLRPSVAKPPGRLGAAPGRGLCKRSPQLPVPGRFVRLPPTDDGRGRGRWARHGRQLETAAFVGRNRGGGSTQPPQGGLASEARNFQLPGVLRGFHPRTLAAAEGVGARHGQPLKTAAFTCETAGGGSTQPPAGGLADEARNFQLPGVLRDFHPRTMAAAEGVGSRHGRQLETAAFSCETAGAVNRSPRRGLCKLRPVETAR